jgi:hypothetical protein
MYVLKEVLEIFFAFPVGLKYINALRYNSQKTEHIYKLKKPPERKFLKCCITHTAHILMTIKLLHVSAPGCRLQGVFFFRTQEY